jgi:hypothetical protein
MIGVLPREQFFQWHQRSTLTALDSHRATVRFTEEVFK